MDSTLARPRYAPSGRVDPRRLPLAVVIWMGTILAIAAELQLAAMDSFHFAVLFALFPTMTVVLLTWVCILRGKIRNPLLGCALGVTAAFAGQALHFHADQCLRWGVPWSRVDQLPGYVTFRLSTDRWVHNQEGKLVLAVLPPAPGVVPRAPLAAAAMVAVNTLHLAFEILISACAAGVIGWGFAASPFSELRNCWMRREQRFLSPEDARLLLTALQEQTLDDWAGNVANQVFAVQPRVELVVWFAPSAAWEDIDSDVFLRIGDQGPYLLDPQEAAALVTCFPGIQEIAGPAKPQLSAEAARTADPASARIESIPEYLAGQAVTTKNRLLAAMTHDAIQVGIPACIIALSLTTTFLIGWGVIPAGANWAPLVPIVGGGLLAAVVAKFTFDDRRGWGVRARTRFEIGRLRRALASHPDRLVGADDDEAIPVVWLPRQFWTEPRSAPLGEYDHGLVRVNAAQGLIFFEGDRERVRIPIASVLNADLEWLSPQVADPAALRVVVVLARLGTGVWEFPFVPIGHVDQNWPAATRLFGQIERLRQPEEENLPEEWHA